MKKINFLAIWLCSSFLFIAFIYSCFVFDWDTVNIRKHHLRDVLKEVLQKYINHLKLKKISTHSIKAILGEIHTTKICVIIHIFTKMFSCMWVYSFSSFFLNTSAWLLPTITIIFPGNFSKKKTTPSTLICSPWL